MIGPRIGQVVVPPGTPDGYVPVVEDERLVLADPDANAPEFLVTVINGVPSLVFDGDSQVVYTEVP